MGRGNLTEKQRNRIVSSTRLAYDAETMRQMASELETCAAVLRVIYEDLPKGSMSAPRLLRLIERVRAVLKRYREGRS